MQNFAAHEDFIRNFGDFKAPIRHEREHAIEDRALLHKFVLPPIQTNKAILAIDVEALVGRDHLGGINLRDLIVAGTALEALAVFFLEHLEPSDGVSGEILEVDLRFLHTRFNFLEGLICLKAIIGRNSFDADFREARDILIGDGSAELFDERLEAPANFSEHALPRF